MNREIKFRIWLKEKKQMIRDIHILQKYKEIIGGNDEIFNRRRRKS